MPPPPPKHCFGRDELIETVIGFAENLKPVAFIGAGGIGKTSIALTVLHHDRIKRRFGENRRFIHCDQFPASRAHFLSRLSKVIGAGVENPEDVMALRPFLSSKEMILILDSAESVLDPQGTNAREIYSIVDELSQFKTISLLITSRVTAVPRHCERPELPTVLSMGAARDFFNRTHGNRLSNTVDDLLQRLDFHMPSITLLATTAFHNAWDYDRLAKYWNTQRAQVLHTDHNENLATTIELSLSSPAFHELGPNARNLLEIVAFFPHGIGEINLDWLFPSIPNRVDIFDKFCVLSLAYRRTGFVTMLAPVRDYLRPKDPQTSPLLYATVKCYLNRLSVDVDPGKPGFEGARWIVSEDVNIEHLLYVFTDRDGVWDVCCNFMRHLYWHKPRETILRSRIDALPEDHCSKPRCLYELAQLFGRIRNYPDQIQLLNHVLELERRSGNDLQVVQTLQHLSDVHRLLGLRGAGVRQVEEALEIIERIGDAEGRSRCLKQLALVLFEDKQLDPSDDAASRAIDLVEEKDQGFLACQLHQVLGKIRHSKGETTKAIHHFETALGIASPPNWHEELFWIHHSLAELFGSEDKFDEANSHINQAKSHAIDDTYRLGRAMDMQANLWCLQPRLEDAKSEASRALKMYELCGAVDDARVCRDLLQLVERAM